MTTKKRLYLIRHGESQQNRLGNPLSGVNETPLSPQGIRQCEYLQKHIDQFNIKSVYTSPLVRARQTARIVFSTIEPTIVEGLTEFDYGDYDGKVAGDYPDDPVLSQWLTAPGNLSFPGGGNVDVHAQAALHALTRILRHDDQDIIACVTHRTTIRLVAARILGLHLDHFRNVPCSNCSITELAFVEPDRFSLLSLSVSLKFLGMTADA
jgi:alpha-ribazole phosphatase